MSEILNKNLSFIKKYNKILAEKILQVQNFTKSLEINTNLVEEYNLLIDGIPVHSLTGAQEESKEIFQKLPHNSPNSIHIIYGLGLGYLFDEISQNSDGNLIVIEPDVETLRFVLEIVDFSNEFSKNKAFFVSDLKEFKDIFNLIYRYKKKVSFSAIDFYRHQKSQEYRIIKEEIEKIYGLTSHNFSFQANEIYAFLHSMLGGLDKKLKSPLLSDYKGILKGKPALVVSAGPSLAKNVEYIKNNQDKFVIFAVGTALKTLLKNGIIPDFLNIIEKNNTFVHFDVDETKDMMLICEPYTNKSVFEKEFKQVFLTASEETEASRWFLDTKNRDLVEFETKGTVAYHAIYSAFYLGCSSITLIGQDLAYSDGNCYAKGSAFDGLQCVFDENEKKYKIITKDLKTFQKAYFHGPERDEEWKSQQIIKVLEELNNNLVTVESQKGKMLPTSAVYSLFINYLTDFAQRHGQNVALFNASAGGAQINGFENVDFNEIIEKHAFEPLDKQELFKKLQNVENQGISRIINNLKSEIASIQRLYKLFDKGKALVKELEQEIQQNIYTNNTENRLSRIVDLYVEITNNYTNKSRLLRMITTGYNANISYIMKEYGSDINLKAAKHYFKWLNAYFNSISERLRNVSKMLSDTTEKMEKSDESGNSKG